MAARTVYACETCQPLLLVEGAQLDQRRQKAMAAAKDPKVGWSTALNSSEAGLVVGDDPRGVAAAPGETWLQSLPCGGCMHLLSMPRHTT